LGSFYLRTDRIFYFTFRVSGRQLTLKAKPAAYSEGKIKNPISTKIETSVLLARMVHTVLSILGAMVRGRLRAQQVVMGKRQGTNERAT
jgi:hypothetical protein